MSEQEILKYIDKVRNYFMNSSNEEELNRMTQCMLHLYQSLEHCAREKTNYERRAA